MATRYPGVQRYATAEGDRFSYVLDAGRHPDGRRRQKRVRGFASAREAHEARQAELVGRRQGTRLDPPKKLTVAAYLDLWLETGTADLSPHSRSTYRSIARARIAPQLGAVPLAALDPPRIQRWLNALNRRYAPRTVRQAHAVLRAALRQAVAWRMLPYDPSAGLRLPRLPPPTAEGKAWTADEAAAFLAATAEADDAALWALLLDAGCRIGEALALRWADVDLDGRRVAIRRTLTRDDAHRWRVGETTKGRAERNVAVQPETVARLRRHRAAQRKRRLALGRLWHDLGLVFDRGDGRWCRPATVRARADRLMRAAGVPRLTVHGLRHTCATLLLRDGVETKLVSVRLGHSRTATTDDIYRHVDPAEDRDVAERLAAILAR